jgi:hypothetical protein
MHKIYSKLMGFDVFEFTTGGDTDAVCYVTKTGLIITKEEYYGYGYNYGNCKGGGWGTEGSQLGDGKTFDSYTIMNPTYQFFLD